MAAIDPVASLRDGHDGDANRAGPADVPEAGGGGRDGFRPGGYIITGDQPTVMAPQPEAPAATTLPPPVPSHGVPPPSGSKGYRGLYMTLGALIVLAIIVLAATQLPRFLKTHASGDQTAQVSTPNTGAPNTPRRRQRAAGAGAPTPPPLQPRPVPIRRKPLADSIRAMLLPCGRTNEFIFRLPATGIREPRRGTRPQPTSRREQIVLLIWQRGEGKPFRRRAGWGGPGGGTGSE